MRVTTLLILSLSVFLLSDPLIDLVQGDSVEFYFGEQFGLLYKKSFYIPTLPVDPILGFTNCDPNLMKAIMRAESDFRIHAESWAWAMGVAQFIPSTADWIGLRNPYDPVASSFKLCEYLNYLSRKFNTTEEVLWAYHDGETRVRKSGPTNAGRRYAKRVLKYRSEYVSTGKWEYFRDRILVFTGVSYNVKDGSANLSTGFEASFMGILDGILGLEMGKEGVGYFTRSYLRLTYDFAPFVGFKNETFFWGLSYRSRDMIVEFGFDERPWLYLICGGKIGLQLGNEFSFLVRMIP